MTLQERFGYLELSNSQKKKFTKDFKLPVNVFVDEVFYSALEKLKDTHNTYNKLEMLEKALKFSNEEDFNKISREIVNEAVNYVKNLNSYKKFNTCDFEEYNQFVYKTKKEYSFNTNLYQENNLNKFFFSIDLSKANFSTLKYFNCFSEYETYRSFISRFNTLPYFQESKQLRQVIMGQLNPKRQVKFQEYVMLSLFTILPEKFQNNVTLNHDELVFEFNIEAEKNEDYLDELYEALDSFERKFKMSFTLEYFELTGFKDKKDKLYYKKEFQNGKVELKGVPNLYYMQAYKFLNNIELTENDLLFYHEGLLAKFQEGLFV